MIKLKKTVLIKKQPFFITRQRLKQVQIITNIIFILMIIYYGSVMQTTLFIRIVVLSFIFGLIFITNKGSIQKKYVRILERDKSLKKIRIHDFRHSHASLLINNGEDYLVVKERLGHASITTTIDTYSHLYPSKQKDLADKLDELL